VAAGVQTFRLSDLQTDYAKYQSDIATAAQKAADKARDTEQQRQRDIDQVRNDAEAQKQIDEAHAAELRAAGDGLREQVGKLLADRTALSARLAARGKTVEDLTDLLAQLRAEADDYSGQLATALDDSRRAGFACEASYAALIKH